MQIQVHGVDAEIARPYPPDNGVEIGAVAVEIAAGFMHGVGNSADIVLEHAAGVGIGEHDGRDAAFLQQRLEAVRVDPATGVLGDGNNLEPESRGRGGVGAVG